VTDTKAFPLSVADYWFNHPFNLLDPCYLILLVDAENAMLDSYQSYDQLYTFEIPAGGGYGSFTVAFETPLTVAKNTTAGVVELDAGAATWQTVDVLTVSGFRWIVVMDSFGNIVAAWDCGTVQSLDATKLILTIPESTVTPGVYPLVTFTRNLT
jgi:hypothetical protein